LVIKVVGVGSVGTLCGVALFLAADDDPVFLQIKEAKAMVGRITGDTGKSAEDERVAAGSAVARKRSNVRGAKGPCHLQCLQR
jgi:hypothetical protein